MLLELFFYFLLHLLSHTTICNGVMKATYNEICSEYWVILTVFIFVYSILSAFADC